MEKLETKIAQDYIDSEDDDNEFKYTAQQRSSKLKKMFLVSINSFQFL